MIDAQLSAELAQSCRLLASHQQKPNILDMLHNIEEEFVQKAKDIDRGKPQAAGRLPERYDGGRFGSLSVCRPS
jgi:hypothetical protein